MGARGHGPHWLMEKQRRENPKTREELIIPKIHRDRWTKRLRNSIANPKIKKRVSHNSRKTSFLSWLFLVFPSIQKHFQNITPGKGKNHPVTRGVAKTKNSLQNSSLKRYSLNPSQEFSQRLFLPSDKGGGVHLSSTNAESHRKSLKFKHISILHR